MENGKHILELAERIPVRNINFYIDACRGMSAVDLQKISSPEEAERELKRIKTMILEGGLKTDPQAAIEKIINYFKEDSSIETSVGMKLLGKLIILYLRQGEFQEKAGDNTQFPFNFLSYAVVEDLKFHGHGPSFSFVEKFLDDLAAREIIEPDFHALGIKDRCAKYSHRDMAAVILGYSFAARGAMLPIVRFPTRPAGFVDILIAELKKLIPRGEANRFIKSFRL